MGRFPQWQNLGVLNFLEQEGDGLVWVDWLVHIVLVLMNFVRTEALICGVEGLDDVKRGIVSKVMGIGVDP